MKDRVPLYPGRVTLTPVSGQANTFDLTRADQPTQEGTPLNKASLLKDATAALFGKTNAAVPDDILNLLSKSALAQIKEKYTKTTIGALAVGKTITLNVSGKAKEFIVVHQGKPSSLYDDSCNGTWLLMKDIYENRVWQSGNINKYESSDIHSYLNNTFLKLFDSNIQGAIKQVKLPYRKNGGSGGTTQQGANGLPCKIFLLSAPEVHYEHSNSDSGEGAALSYFASCVTDNADSKRVAYLNGSAAFWWLRSPDTGNTYYVWYVYSDGDCTRNGASASSGIRPALILPSTLAIYTDSSGNIYTEQEYETKITDVLGNLISIPADQIKDCTKNATGSYTGTGTYGENNPNRLTFDFVPRFFTVGSLETISDGSGYVHSVGRGYIMLIINGGLALGYNLSSNYCKLDGNTISWYAYDNEDDQFNSSGKKYGYIAIG